MLDARYLLVTTTRAAWLLDTRNGRAKLIDEGRGVYYGISFSEDELFIACRNADVGADRAVQRNIILCFDGALRPTRTLHPPVPMRDVHQICYHDGTLFVCSTFDDAVLRYKVATRSWDRWEPFGPGEGLDRYHINSITVGANGFLLAGNRPSGWAARFALDGTPLGERVQIGAGTHNVWLEDEQLTVCSSNEGAIRWERSGVEPVVAHGWLRGYGQARGSRYVGVSQNLVRGVRERSDCMVLRLGAKGFVEASYSFRGFGMLHDLRVTGLPDPSHNGLTFAMPDVAVRAMAVTYQTTPQGIALALQGM